MSKLIENESVFKEVLGGIQTKMNFGTVEPFVKAAEWSFRKTVGKDLYDWLKDTAFGADSDEAQLREFARGCIGWAAYDMALPHLKQRVGDLGMMKTSPNGTVSITKWEYVDTREANLSMVDFMWENFWGLLEELNPNVWKTSTAYQNRNQYFIRSAAEMTEYVSLVGRNTRFFQKLLPYLQRAEQNYIAGNITEEVFEDLKEKFQDPDQTMTHIEKKIVEKIRWAVAHFALYEAYPYLPLVVDEDGVREIRKKDGTREEEIADKRYRNAQRQQLYQDGQLYLGQLKEYLNSVSDASSFVAYYEAYLMPTDDKEEDFTDKPHIIL